MQHYDMALASMGFQERGERRRGCSRLLLDRRVNRSLIGHRNLFQLAGSSATRARHLPQPPEQLIVFGVRPNPEPENDIINFCWQGLKLLAEFLSRA